MEEHYPPILKGATPDDVLAIFCDGHRQACSFNSAPDASIVLSRDLTIARWRKACCFSDWETTAKQMNAAWSVEIRLHQWRTVLEPPKEHTLGEVCDLLSQYVKVPRAQPLNIFGTECLPAGVFMTIRSFLSNAGADVSGMTPSTPLAPFTRRYPAVFLGSISELAPGTLPAVKIRRPHYHVCVFMFVLSWIGMLFGQCANLPMLTVWSVVWAALAYFGMWISGRYIAPTNVEFQGLHTFRDLSKAVAAGAHP